MDLWRTVDQVLAVLNDAMCRWVASTTLGHCADPHYRAA